MGDVLKETIGLRTTNLVVALLSVAGGLILVFTGATRCVADCEYSWREISPDPITIAFGIAAMLLAGLTYQVINVFALHVEKSHE
jgi:hypothetical protein